MRSEFLAMTTMAKKLSGLASTLGIACAVALAASTARADGAANIDRGNVQVSGAGAIEWQQNQSTLWTLNAGAEYFVLDHFSVGGMVKGLSQGSTSSFGIGPSLTWHILQIGRFVPFIGAGVDYETATNTSLINGTSNGWTVDGKVGINWFFTPSVAFGPEYIWTNYAPTGSQTGSMNNSELLFQFSMFL